MKNSFNNNIQTYLELEYGKTVDMATTVELYNAVSKSAMNEMRNNKIKLRTTKTACYFSTDYLTGRLIYANLLNLGLLEKTKDFLEDNNIDINVFEDIEESAPGNGGLGRLAACFLDSAATQSIPLDGFGIRYRYGVFKQCFENGMQKEIPDKWQRFCDPWSVKREDKTVIVKFGDQQVKAVPYDTPIIGYKNNVINNLRLYESEPITRFDYDVFSQLKYDKVCDEYINACAISSVLNPNDDTDKGKRLRLKQQYFFTSAALQNILNDFKESHGNHFNKLPEFYAIGLNETHPVVAIPELIRLLMEESLTFINAFNIARKVFAYTNHSARADDMGKWNVRLFKSVIPEIYKILVKIDKILEKELSTMGVPEEQREQYRIISDKIIYMGRLAIFATFSTNGVSKQHTEILKSSIIPEWYKIYPDRINNKTNGISQRRWLLLANPQLSSFISKRILDKWIKNLEELKKLEKYKDDESSLIEFIKIKKQKKQELADYIEKFDGVIIDPEFVFDIQIKCLQEYKRQLMNALSIIYIYFSIKDGSLKDFNPTAFIFGAKSSFGNNFGMGIIKLVNEIADKINSDLDVSEKIAVLFVQNYNVSYAEKLIPACDISEQISTAGTEISGTCNLKFMLNGAVTLGTYDGANIEIVREAGEENNYIFGARVEELKDISESYDPTEIYKNNPKLKRVVDSLVDGTFDDDGTGLFADMYKSLLEKTENNADSYFTLYDFESYINTKLKAISDYSDNLEFGKKCFLNVCNAGKFSSDKTIKEYAQQIWFAKK